MISSSKHMKLKSFRIHNFRSIKDSGWNELSPDNITGIIGQNESGKTSILEGLSSFYSGTVSEDVLRGDMTIPIVSCCFELDPQLIPELLNEKELPLGVLKSIKASKTLCLTRIWNEDMGSRIELAGEKASNIFDKHDTANIEHNLKLQKTIDKCLEKKDKAVSLLMNAEEEKNALSNEVEKYKLLIPEAQKEIKSVKDTREETLANSKLQKTKGKFEKASADLSQKKKDMEGLKDEAEDLIRNSKLAESSRQAKIRFEKAQSVLDSTYKELRNIQRILNTIHYEIDRRGVKLELDKLNDKYVKSLQEYDQSKEDDILKRNLAYKVLAGLPLESAEREMRNEKPHIDPFYSREEAGKILFDYIPEFVLFEDFSSLLPNKIDLEDILSENQNVEGFRAARNFLKLSGLTPQFFVEGSSRLLKQKIEKLNKDISIDFQDFWRQKIGKKNKITINFELEHYSQSYPDKTGYPYLEFWIKDRHERLYPKQRSRGVRWFLSFYLELKAAAISDQNKGMVLLIDEPGLSLHARAQEDVLKVFEDIKDKIQVVYTTHSPHLIDAKKIYRLLAVQRAIENDDSSETKIFNAKSLTAASADTLSPIYTLIGARLSEQQYIRQKNNVILEDISTYYYLSTILTMIDLEKEVYLLPASNISNVETLVNLLLGWGIDFVVLTGGNSKGLEIHGDLKQNLCRGDQTLVRKYLINMDQFQGVEDLFSTLDFKKLILHQRVGIPESNSEFLKENRYSRAVLASNFMNEVQDNNLKFEDFDEETRDNFRWLFNRLDSVLY